VLRAAFILILLDTENQVVKCVILYSAKIMEDNDSQGMQEKPDVLMPAENEDTEENKQAIIRGKWQNMLIQMAFLLAGILLFVFINYIFGFMKGN